MSAYDLIVRGGTLVNHAGEGPGDVGVRGGRITAIGDLATASADQVFDAKGLHVLPGFIDTRCISASQATSTRRIWKPVRARQRSVASPACSKCPTPPRRRRRPKRSPTRSNAPKVARTWITLFYARRIAGEFRAFAGVGASAWLLRHQDIHGLIHRHAACGRR